jgi:hypothetical protein
MIVWLTPARVGHGATVLLVVRLAATMAITLVSYVVIERPIRERRLLRGSFGWTAAPAAVAVTVVLAVTALGGSSVATASPVPVASASGPSTSIAAVASIDPPSTTAPDGAGPTTSIGRLGAPLADPTSTTAAPVDPLAGRHLLVVGDSGAYFLGQGLVTAGAERHAAVDNRGTIGCGVARASGKARLPDGSFLPDPAGCAAWPERFRTAVVTTRPDVALLVLAWPGYGDRLVGGAWVHPCQASFDAWYQGEVRLAIESLRQPGTQVVVALAAYYTGPNPQPDAHARVDCLDATYRAAAAAEPGTTTVDLNAFACPAGTCRKTIDGVELRKDGLHFRDAGATLAGRWVLDALATTSGSGGGPPAHD